MSKRKMDAQCPNCGSSDTRRSCRKGFFAAIFSFVGRVPLRCRSCQKRFYRGLVGYTFRRRTRDHMFGG